MKRDWRLSYVFALAAIAGIGMILTDQGISWRVRVVGIGFLVYILADTTDRILENRRRK